jgi:hypothetical protein
MMGWFLASSLPNCIIASGEEISIRKEMKDKRGKIKEARYEIKPRCKAWSRYSAGDTRKSCRK